MENLDLDRNFYLSTFIQIKRDFEKYPFNHVFENEKIISEIWKLKEDNLEYFKRGIIYLSLWKENMMIRYENFYEFIEDQIIYKPSFNNDCLIQHSFLNLKILVISKDKNES